MTDASCLQATEFIDADHPAIRSFARDVTTKAANDRERAALLFGAVRDGIRYDPYAYSTDRREYVASTVLQQRAAFCIPKAVLLTAAARAVGIPARLGFSDVRNHLQSERLSELMGTDLFVFHGYSDLYLEGAWRKATPAFNADLCTRFGVPPLEFDGSEDALFHAYTTDGTRHMEYVRDRGTYPDLPFEEITATLRQTYAGALEQVAVARDDPAFR